MKLPKELTTITKTSKILAAILFVTLPFLGFFAGVNYQQTLDSVSQTSTNESMRRIPTPTPSQSIDTSNWKTYKNKKRGYSFKHPSFYSLKEYVASSTTFEGVILENEVVSVPTGEGENAIKSGNQISFVIIPNKNLSDASLKDEYGSNIKIQKKLLDQKEVTEIIFPNQMMLKVMFYRIDQDVLKVSMIAGFEVSKQKYAEYLSNFNQILQTFQFTN